MRVFFSAGNANVPHLSPSLVQWLIYRIHSRVMWGDTVLGTGKGDTSFL